MIAAFRALPGAQKVLWSLGVLLTPLFIIGAVSPTPGMQKMAEVYQTTESPAAATTEVPIAAIVTPAPHVLPTETKTIIETVVLPYTSTTQDDPTLEIDKTAVATRGVNGEKLITYTVTYTEGRETSRILVSEKIIRQPISEIRKLGTKPKAAPATAVKPGQTLAQCDPQQKHDKPCVQLNTVNICAEGSYHSGVGFGTVRLLGLTLRLEQSDPPAGCE